MRTPNHASCSLPISQRKCTISGIHLLIITKGDGYCCIGYLDHPFKNRPFETEKDRHPLLANRGGLVYNQTLSQAYACLNNDTLR
jgi:hypothetical protein